jgi:hypothetical protein
MSAHPLIDRMAFELAMSVLQSDLYSQRPETKQLVDDILVEYRSRPREISQETALWTEALEDDGTWSRLNKCDPAKANDEFMLSAKFDPKTWRVVRETIEIEIVWPKSRAEAELKSSAVY